jgi:hypothetical protein
VGRGDGQDKTLAGVKAREHGSIKKTYVGGGPIVRRLRRDACERARDGILEGCVDVDLILEEDMRERRQRAGQHLGSIVDLGRQEDEPSRHPRRRERSLPSPWSTRWKAEPRPCPSLGGGTFHQYGAKGDDSGKASRSTHLSCPKIHRAGCLSRSGRARVSRAFVASSRNDPRLTERVDVENVREARRDQHVLRERGDHVPRVELERANGTMSAQNEQRRAWM